MHDYNIKLEEGKSSVFKSLYNLSKIKLHVLKDYIKQALSMGWICVLINPVKTLILFILKKDRTLQLYIDYYALNNIIIKNQHSLLLINKTLT